MKAEAASTDSLLNPYYLLRGSRAGARVRCAAELIGAAAEHLALGQKLGMAFHPDHRFIMGHRYSYSVFVFRDQVSGSGSLSRNVLNQDKAESKVNVAGGS